MFDGAAVKFLLKRPLWVLFIIDFLFSATFGMFHYSAYKHLFDNHPLSSFMIVGIIYHVLAATGAISAFTSFIGKYILNFKKIFIYSLLLQALGCYILALNKFELLNLGFAIYTVAYGYVVTCITLFIDHYLEQKKASDKEKRWVFTLDALYFNSGILIGSLIGLYSQDFGILFLYGFIFCVVSLIFYLLGYDVIEIPIKLENNSKYRHGLFVIICVLLILITYASFYVLGSTIINSMMIFSGILIFIYMAMTFVKVKQGQKQQLNIFMYYLIFFTIAWGVYQFVPMMAGHMAMFNSTDMLFGYKIGFDTNWVGIINSIILVVMTVILSFYFQKRSVSYKNALGISLSIMLLAFFVLLAGTFYAVGEQVMLSFIVAFIAIMSVGEVLLIPCSYTIVNEMIPVDDRPIFYAGVSYLTKSVAPLVSGIFIYDALFQRSSVQLDYFQLMFGIVCCVLLIPIMLLMLIKVSK